MKRIVEITSICLIIVELMIMYYWIFDWTKLITTAGLTIWIVSALLGIGIYLLFKKVDKVGRETIIVRITVNMTTSIIIFLGCTAVIIEYITRSMP